MSKFTVILPNGERKDVDTEDLSTEGFQTLQKRVESGEFKVAQPTKDRYPVSPGAGLGSDKTLNLEKLIEGLSGSKETNKILGQNKQVSPISLMEKPIVGALEGGLSGAASGPWGMGIGALTGAGMGAMGHGSETPTDSIGNITGSNITQLLTELATSRLPGGPAKKALIRAGIQGLGTYATGVGQQAANIASDPARTLSQNYQNPDPRAAILSGAMGGAGSLGGDIASKLLSKTPTSQAAQIQNKMTGSNITPPQLPEAVQSNPNTATNVRKEQLAFQKQARIQQIAEQNNITLSKAKEIVLKEDLAQAKGLNKQDIGLTKNRTLESNPVLDQAKETLSTSDSEIKRLTTELKESVKKPNYAQESVRIQDELNNHQQAKISAQQQLDQIQKQNQARASDILLKQHEVPQSEEGQIFPNSQAVKDTTTKLYQEQKNRAKSEQNLLTIQRNIDNGKYGSEVAPIFKGTKNTEEMVNRLMNSDSFVINRFMKTVGKDFPDIKQRVTGDILRQSWDQNSGSFSNFTKLYGNEGSNGNPVPRLAAVLGDKDKAHDVLDAVQLMDKGLQKNKEFQQGQKYMLGAGALTMVYALTNSHIPTHFGTVAGAEGATMLALSIPKLLDTVTKSKTLYEPFKQWAESGFTTVPKPLYQALMDSGDHYKYDDFGNPELIKK